MNIPSTALLLLITLLSPVLSQKNYTSFAFLNNPDSLESSFFLNKLDLAFLYDQTNRTATVYRTYNWQPVSDSVFTDFQFPPTYVEQYSDSTYSAHLVYANSEGQLRQKSFSSAGYSGRSLWTISDTAKNIKRVTASSDGVYYAAFARGSTKVYIGLLNTTDSLVQVREYAGQILAIRWRPGTNKLYISGKANSNSTGQNLNDNEEPSEQLTEQLTEESLSVNDESKSDHYLRVYDVPSKTQQDIVFISQSPVTDLAFSPEGSKLYFIEQPLTPGQRVIYLHDLVTKNVRQFDKSTGETPFSSLNVNGQYLTTYADQTIFIWSITDQKLILSHGSHTEQIGISADGADVIIPDVGHAQVLKLCGDMHHYYNPSDDSCQNCQSPCDTCFGNDGSKCSSCLPRYYPVAFYQCESCQSGCYSCQNSTECLACDSQKHFVMNGSDCICHTGYYLSDQGCSSCSDLFEGCIECDSIMCSKCAENYDMNLEFKCIKQEQGSNVVLIVIIVLAVLLVAAVAGYCWKRKQKERAKHVQTSLESSQPMEDYEKVDN